MRTRQYDKYAYLADYAEPRKVTIDTSRITNKFKPNNSLKCIEQIYIYLNGGRTGIDDFITLVKSKYGQSTVSSCGRTTWEFDKPGVLGEFWNTERLKPILEEQGLDDYDRLYYRATHPDK